METVRARAMCERGQAGGLEALVFGLLLFVAGTLVVANVWGVVDAKFATSQAAREAARAYVETGRDQATADRAARAAAEAALTGHRRAEGADIAPADAVYQRCGRIAYRVTVPVRVLVVPFLTRATTGFRVSSTHAELIDPYREGLAGVASCS